MQIKTSEYRIGATRVRNYIDIPAPALFGIALLFVVIVAVALHG